MAIEFSTWPPDKLANGRGHTSPVGSVTIRTEFQPHKGGKHEVRVRYVKTREDGPSHARWAPAARVWWERNKGPVPSGLRVVHKDGDTLNDDPSNYAIMTATEVLYLYRAIRPDVVARNAKGCGEHITRLNLSIRDDNRRAGRFPKSKWFPVDLARGVIYEYPCRKRWEVYAAFGVKGVGGQARYDVGASLGWPGLGRLETSLVSALSTGKGVAMAGAKMIASACEMHLINGWAVPRKKTTIYGAITRLHSNGLVSSIRLPGYGGKFHSLTPAAIRIRGSICPVIAVQGRHLMRRLFSRFSIKPIPSLTPERGVS